MKQSVEFRAAVNVRSRKCATSVSRPIYTHLTPVSPLMQDAITASGAIKHQMKKIGMEVVEVQILRRVVSDWEVVDTLK